MDDNHKKILMALIAVLIIAAGILWLRSGDSEPGQLIPPADNGGLELQMDVETGVYEDGEEVVAPEPSN